jgi:hypothetical protein
VLEIPYKVIKSEISISIERIAKTYNEQLKKIEALKIEMNQAHQNDELIKKLEAFEALSPLPELTEKTEAEYYRKKLERMYLM